VAFGRGGTEPTVTDAHVAAGTIDAGRIAGGVTLDVHGARAAVAALAARLGAAPGDVCRAIVATADAAMARALRRVSVERGVDPRTCVLVAFGGGGPLHACGLAERVGVTRIVVPPFAGVLSALGLAIAAERREVLTSVMRHTAALDVAALAAVAAGLAERAGALARRQFWARCRYAGQGHELDVPFGPGDDGRVLAERFAALHGERFGFTLDRAVEVVSARHAASGDPHPLRLRRGAPPARRGSALHDDGSELDAVVRGPATIALPDATLFVAAGWTAQPLEIGGWLLEQHG
jgi:N-methylhydantoinase A